MTHTPITELPVSASSVNAALAMLDACGEYSKANPSVPLRGNPHYLPSRRVSHNAFSSADALWFCRSCGSTFPHVEEDLSCSTCGGTVLVDLAQADVDKLKVRGIR